MRRLSIATFLLAIMLLNCVPSLAQTPEQGGLTDSESKHLFREFNEIRSFGIISVSLLGDAEKIGLDQKVLTETVKGKFKTNFKGIPYEDLTQDPETFMNLVAQRDREVGNITFRVWVIGTEYPVVYHIRCDSGNFDNPAIYTEEVLGHGTPKTAPENIRHILGEMMGELAAGFTKSRATGS